MRPICARCHLPSGAFLRASPNRGSVGLDGPVLSFDREQCTMPKLSRDTNALIGAALRDLAAAQASKRAGFGYKRAANAVLNLDSQIDTLISPDGRLPKIPNVGPKSERVIREVLDTGTSQLVEKAVVASGNEEVIARARTLRKNFLSRAAAVAALRAAKSSRDLPALADYRGDLQ